ncbi:HTH_Tnp_Tc3_2 domain-containing protein [Trichonephila clavipes]|nr:HTH_Tnp_Tc3_2 domain-containing protein [Trichonephila clavipes]
MGKLPNLDDFDRGFRINFRNRQTDRIFKLDSFKGIQRIHGWWTKTSDRVNCKGQLALTVRGATRTSSKWTVQRVLHRRGSENRRPTRSSLLNVRHRAARLAWGKRAQELECRGLEMSSMKC